MTSDLRSHDDVYIDGRWRTAHSPGRITLVNPATEQAYARVPDADAVDVDAAVDAARRALPGWAGTPASTRAKAVEALADAIEARRDAFALALTTEVGTPISETAAAAGHAGAFLRWFAGLAEEVERVDVRPNPAAPAETVVSRQPVGVAGLIIPWNYPLGLVAVKLAPALMAGCTTVIKPAAETPMDLRVLVEAVEAAGLPPGLVNVVTGDRATGSALVEHPGVDKIAFTGSTAAGRAIGQACGRLLRPVTLELGGKSAAVLLDDVDLDAFAPQAVRVTMRNTGQTCHACTRLLAPRARYDEVVDAVVQAVRQAPQGDPLDPDSVFGPLVSDRQRGRVESYIAAGREDGARVVAGGGRPADLPRGWYVEPTVFADVDNGMRIAREEIFGPVLVVIPHDGDDDAVRLANDSPYGLGGTVFSADEDRAAAVAARMETGSVGLNFYASNPAAPFGGHKDSGLGVEFGVEGLAAFQRLKSVHRRR